MDSHITAVVQARLGSRRFPEKVFQLINGQSLLLHCINRLRNSKKINRIIIATTKNIIDNPIEEFCSSNNLECYRGSENNVLNRFLNVCHEYKISHFIRVCSDNPFIDIELMDNQVTAFGDEYDYCSYYTKYDEPLIIKPSGLFTECVSLEALERSQKLGGASPLVREHVTFYIHQAPQLFKIKKLTIPDWVNPELRFTIDYPEDLRLANSLLTIINDNSTKSLMELLNKDVGIMRNVKLNSSIHQKNY